jgi:hypothetical protein
MLATGESKNRSKKYLFGIVLFSASVVWAVPSSKEESICCVDYANLGYLTDRCKKVTEPSKCQIYIKQHKQVQAVTATRRMVRRFQEWAIYIVGVISLALLSFYLLKSYLKRLPKKAASVTNSKPVKKPAQGSGINYGGYE